MSLNDTPSGERTTIAFLGRRNAGKSSLVNAVTGQALSVVSDVAGTTTDAVRKAMELLPLGPVVIVDTPGLDDVGELGEKRVAAAQRAIDGADAAVLVVDGTAGMADEDREALALLSARGVPHVVAFTRADVTGEAAGEVTGTTPPEVHVSTVTGAGVTELKELLARIAGGAKGPERQLVGDLLEVGDAVVLVVPIDKAAPKGRLILPQQQVIRDVLEAGAQAIVTRETELEAALASLAKPPVLVICDSQVFGKVAAMVPPELPLTSFSVLFARYKGELAQQTAGARTLDTLRDGDRVLVAEGCTHHRQCGDIGTQKIPAWVRAHSGAEPVFEFTSGREFPTDVSGYALVIHCGGCTLGPNEMRWRLERCREQGVPVTNYGLAIAHMHGILERSLTPLGM